MKGSTKRKSPAASESPEKDNLAYLKRREQVRRAQRTHRERKEAYIKSLEHEIMEHSTRHEEIEKEKRRLQSDVERMRELLHVHGISADEELGAKATSQFSKTSAVPNLSYSISHCSSSDVIEAATMSSTAIPAGSTPPNTSWRFNDHDPFEQFQFGLPLLPDSFTIPDFSVDPDWLTSSDLCIPPNLDPWSNTPPAEIYTTVPTAGPILTTDQSNPLNP